MSTSLEPLVGGLRFPEGPRWREGRLYFSDIADHCVKSVDLDGKLEVVERIHGRPSGLGWLPDGRMLVVEMQTRTLHRLDPEGWTQVADISRFCGGHANDMVVSADGRAYVGNIGFDLEAEPMQPQPTVITCIDPDGTARAVAPDVMCPNGMVITDTGTLIAGESAAGRLSAFDVEADGALANRRVFAELPEGVAADGICLDAEGAIWVASPTTNEFLRVLEGGRVASSISSGDRSAIACMLGGPDRRTLFALTNTTHDIRQAEHMAEGRIDVARVDAPGAGLP